MKTTKAFLAATGFSTAFLFLAASPAVGAEDSLVTSVFSSVHNGYVRKKLPDGTFKRETYAIANGQYTPGISRDHSIDDVKFPSIAGVVAKHLAKQNYFLAQDSKSADLLLLISWGKTVPFNDAVHQANTNGVYSAMNGLTAANAMVKASEAATGQQRSVDGIQSPERSVRDAAADELEGQLYEMQMFNDMRMKANERNARLLGYVREINDRNDNSRFAGGGTFYDDLNNDLEAERYYVIVSAYDFHAAVKDGKRKLLWATRVSIQSQGNRFNERLLTMVENASRQFGQNTNHLIRQYQPDTHVDLGEMKFLGLVPESELHQDQSPPKKD